MSRIYGCVVHCYKEDVRNETLEDQITAIILGSVHAVRKWFVLKNMIFYFKF